MGAGLELASIAVEVELGFGADGGEGPGRAVDQAVAVPVDFGEFEFVTVGEDVAEVGGLRVVVSRERGVVEGAVEGESTRDVARDDGVGGERAGFRPVDALNRWQWRSSP